MIWERTLQTTSPLKLHNRFTPRDQVYTPRDGLSNVQRIMQFHTCAIFFSFSFSIFGLFPFFPFSLTWDYMGVKVSNDISSENTHQIHSQKLLYTPTSTKKNVLFCFGSLTC